MSTRYTSIADVPLMNEADEFGIERYVQGLIKFIRHSTTPITIALQGEWGSGKTSLMNRLNKELCSPSGEFIGININTWEFSMLSSPEMTVLRIIEKLTTELSHKDDSAGNTVKRFLKSVGNTAYKIGREGAKIIGGTAGSLLVEAVMPGDIASGEEARVSLPELRDALESAIAKSMASDKKGVIVFVDDLDRLNPPVAVEILELLKNIFTLRNCIFVLAIDYDVVVKGLKPKFGELTEKNEREFRSFFDKIIQVPFSLPVNSYQPEDFIIEHLKNVGYLGDANLRLTDDMKREIGTIVNLTVGKNPRAIKRLINSLSLISCIVGDNSVPPEGTSRETEKVLTFAIVAIQISYPIIYRMMAENPDIPAWDGKMVRKFTSKKVKLNSQEEKDAEYDKDWQEVLSRVCDSNPYLVSHESDIADLLNMILQKIGAGDENVDVAKTLRTFIDRSSVTDISVDRKESGNGDYKPMMSQLLANVASRLKATHPDWDIEAKGANILMNPQNVFTDGKPRRTALRLKEVKDGRVTLNLTVPYEMTVANFPNIQRLYALGHKGALDDEKFAAMIADYDTAVSALLADGLISGDIIRNRYENNWQKNGEWLNPSRILWQQDYQIHLPDEAGFDDPAVINSLTTLHEALWRLYHDMQKI